MSDATYPAPYGALAEPAVEVPPKDLRDYLSMLRRRRGLIAAIVVALGLVTILVAWLIPPSYRSIATILVQEQEIPSEFVRSTVTSYADERISVISQQVMTRQVLLGLVDRYGLYEGHRRTQTTEEVLDRMRKDIKLSTVNANVSDRRGGQVSGTIAFQISYESGNPAQTQRVVSDLVSLYLNENVKTRQQRAAETSAFLAEEGDRLGAQISEMEAKLADFKQKNQGRLPELAQSNMAAIDRAENEVARIDREITSLEDRKVYLQNQLAQVKDLVPLPPVATESGASRSLDPAERLKSLRNQFTSLSAIYSEQHPDLVRLRREIDALRKEVGAEDGGSDNAEKLADARNELAALRERYSDDHPDVVKLRRSVAALEAAGKGTSKREVAKKDTGPSRAETQFTITVRSQIDSANAEIRNLRNAKRDLQVRIKQIEARVAQTPLVEKEYMDLVRDYDNAMARYKDIKSKQMQAQVAESLEKDRKAERFTLIDPPQLPERPVSPNRPMILLIGMVGALGAGFGVGFMREMFDRTVRGARDLGRLVGAPVLGTVPYLENTAERARRSRRRVFGFVGLVALVLALLAIVHFFFTPLPVLWYVISRRIGL